MSSNGNGYLDGNEDTDGDGNLDVNEPDWDSDGVLDNRVGSVTQIRFTVDQFSTFATELGFGDIIHNVSTGDYPSGYYETIANAPMEGFLGAVLEARGRTALSRSQSSGDQVMTSPSKTSDTVHKWSGSS